MMGQAQREEYTLIKLFPKYEKKKISKKNISIVSKSFSLKSCEFVNRKGQIISPKDLKHSEEYFVLGDPITIPTPKYKTGIVYDKRMELHKLENTKILHAEVPNRIIAIKKFLQNTGIWKKCARIKSKKCTKEELMLCHEEKYVDKVLNGSLGNEIESILENLEKEFGEDESDESDEVYWNKFSSESILISCGSTIELVRNVLKGDINNSFAIVRPPGHHARSKIPMGFCFVANVMIAAKVAVKEFGLKRILVVDWDVHHGNGSQSMLKSTNNILFFSIHRNYYPWTGGIDNVSNGKAINVSFSEPFGNNEMINAFKQIFLPVAKEYKPQLILVSAGFDACKNDLFGGCSVTPECYGMLTEMLMSVTGGKNICLVLEGGYNNNVTALCVTECVKCLLGFKSSPVSLSKKTTDSSKLELEEVKKIQSKYFKFLKK